MNEARVRTDTNDNQHACDREDYVKWKTYRYLLGDVQDIQRDLREIYERIATQPLSVAVSYLASKSGKEAFWCNPRQAEVNLTGEFDRELLVEMRDGKLILRGYLMCHDVPVAELSKAVRLLNENMKVTGFTPKIGDPSVTFVASCSGSLNPDDVISFIDSVMADLESLPNLQEQLDGVLWERYFLDELFTCDRFGYACQREPSALESSSDR